MQTFIKKLAVFCVLMTLCGLMHAGDLHTYLIDEAIPVYEADSIAFYSKGTDKFESLLRDMRAARHHIHAEYFIFANDSIGNLVIDVMRQKAREGVEIRLVIDGYYDVKRGYDYASRISQLQADGIDIRIYEPYVFPYAHRVLRDHRKIVVIDGQIGYTGGFNVADYNIHGKPGIYGDYCDMHVRLEGSCVEGLQHLFSDHFEKCATKRLPSRFSKGFDGAAYYPYTAAAVEGDSQHDMDKAVCILERGRQTHRKKAEMRRAIVSIIDSATDSLHISSPYFLPTPAIRRAIRRAQERGIHIEILFSEHGDTPMFDYGNVHYGRRLQRRGAEIWLYEGAFQHSKTIMVDGRNCMVGSVNLDFRATRWNEEDAALIFNTEATQWLDSAFVQNQQGSHRLNTQYYKQLPYKNRILGAFANYFLSWCL
ncbi:MAG: phosphatidylserine/phosphatidylglycerophosphate/cardiolipin synthase family protein [Bacteroidales bacterium]|nr:phosphatidylserine/phosphatidylglycerophosphate/cardiolipin synthase family protein [Candidatus Liminaster caballi]